MYYLYFVFVVFLLGQAYLFSPVATSARFDAEVEANLLNVRAGPGLQFDILDRLPHGSKVSILDDEVRERGREVNENWTKVFVEINDRHIVGWVCDRYLERVHIARPQVASIDFRIPEAPESRNLHVTVSPETPVAEVARPEIAFAELAIVSPTPAPSPEMFKGEVFFAISGLTSPPALLEQRLPPLGYEGDKRLAVSFPSQVGEPNVAPEWVPKISLVTPPKPSVATKPLNYEALGIDCRRSYFGSSFEGCTTRIAVEVDLTPEEFQTKTAPISCEVKHRLTVSGSPRLETVSKNFEVKLENRRGSTVAELLLEFGPRLADVTRVTAESVTCRPEWQ